MPDCIFCSIIAKQIPNHTVYEDDFTLAFLDVHPCVKGHTVVIPKMHTSFINDLDDIHIQHLLPGVRKAMERLQETLRPDGFTVGWNHGAAGKQSVPHLHVHILPRYQDDGGGSMHSVVRRESDLTLDEVVALVC